MSNQSHTNLIPIQYQWTPSVRLKKNLKRTVVNYTVSTELAILRQRDTKPDEYQTYFSFCEECKEKVRKELYS